MKNLQSLKFDPAKCRTEWNQFSSLLSGKAELSERNDVLPFFKNRHHLSTLIGSYFPKMAKADCFAHEFEIYGDFIADLIVGDSTEQRYVLVEFEDGTAHSIFKRKGKKATLDWAPRFEAAYSQLVDWLWKLDDMRNTLDFAHTFGSSRASFHGLIVIGKDMKLEPQEKDRLKWRMDKTLIDSKAVSSVSFNQLVVDLDYWLTHHHGV